MDFWTKNWVCHLFFTDPHPQRSSNHNIFKLYNSLAMEPITPDYIMKFYQISKNYLEVNLVILSWWEQMMKLGASVYQGSYTTVNQQFEKREICKTWQVILAILIINRTFSRFTEPMSYNPCINGDQYNCIVTGEMISYSFYQIAEN